MIYVEQYFPDNKPGKRFKYYKFDSIGAVIYWMSIQGMIKRLTISDMREDGKRYKYIKYPVI